VKRARYAAELAAALGAKSTRKYLKRAKRLQDVLGDHQDAVVATEVLHGLGEELRDPPSRAAIEALFERQGARRDAARAASRRRGSGSTGETLVEATAGRERLTNRPRPGRLRFDPGRTPARHPGAVRVPSRCVDRVVAVR
jgi:hypothetical protein